MCAAVGDMKTCFLVRKGTWQRGGGAQERADFLANIVLDSAPLMAVTWTRARIECAGHEGDALDTICACDKEAEVLYHVPLVRVVPPKILLDGGDKLMNDARYKLFARCCVLCHSRAPARWGSATCRTESKMMAGKDVPKEQRPP